MVHLNIAAAMSRIKQLSQTDDLLRYRFKAFNNSRSLDHLQSTLKVHSEFLKLALASQIFVYDSTMMLDTALPSIDVDQHVHFMYKLQ